MPWAWPVKVSLAVYSKREREREREKWVWRERTNKQKQINTYLEASLSSWDFCQQYSIPCTLMHHLSLCVGSGGMSNQYSLYSSKRIFLDFLTDFLSHFWRNKNGVNKRWQKNGTYDKEVKLSRMRGLLLKMVKVLIFTKEGSCVMCTIKQKREKKILFFNLDLVVDLVT